MIRTSVLLILQGICYRVYWIAFYSNNLHDVPSITSYSVPIYLSALLFAILLDIKDIINFIKGR